MNEYWIVTENRTGRVIAHCGDVNDAIMLVSFAPDKRSYSRHRFLMDQVIDITSITDKKLPGQKGLSSGKVNQINPEIIRLKEGEGHPVIL